MSVKISPAGAAYNKRPACSFHYFYYIYACQPGTPNEEEEKIGDCFLRFSIEFGRIFYICWLL